MSKVLQLTRHLPMEKRMRHYALAIKASSDNDVNERLLKQMCRVAFAFGYVAATKPGDIEDHFKKFMASVPEV